MSTFRRAAPGASFVAPCALVMGCGSSNNGSGFQPDASTDGQIADGTASDAGGDGHLIGNDASACQTNAECNGGVCVNGACCASANDVCGSICCAGSTVCLFGACVTPGADCTSAANCPLGQYCETALGSGADGRGPLRGA